MAYGVVGISRPVAENVEGVRCLEVFDEIWLKRYRWRQRCRTERAPEDCFEHGIGDRYLVDRESVLDRLRDDWHQMGERLTAVELRGWTKVRKTDMRIFVHSENGLLANLLSNELVRGLYEIEELKCCVGLKKRWSGLVQKSEKGDIQAATTLDKFDLDGRRVADL